MIRTALLCLLGALLLGLFLVSVKAGTSVLNDEAPHVELTWEVLGDPATKDPKEIDIEFTVKTDTTGWVGIGFALSPAMFPSDNIIMWVDNDDEAHAEDRFSTDHTMPTLDSSSGGTDDVQLISGEQTSTGQTFVVRRKLETDDTMHDHVIGPDPIYVLWAVGDTDDFTEQHVAEGSKMLVLVGDGAVSGSVASSATASASASASASEHVSDTGSVSASGRINSNSLSASSSTNDETSAASTTRAALGLIAAIALFVAAL